MWFYTPSLLSAATSDLYIFKAPLGRAAALGPLYTWSHLTSPTTLPGRYYPCYWPAEQLTRDPTARESADEVADYSPSPNPRGFPLGPPEVQVITSKHKGQRKRLKIYRKILVRKLNRHLNGKQVGIFQHTWHTLGIKGIQRKEKIFLALALCKLTTHTLTQTP